MAGGGSGLPAEAELAGMTKAELKRFLAAAGVLLPSREQDRAAYAAAACEHVCRQRGRSLCGLPAADWLSEQDLEAALVAGGAGQEPQFVLRRAVAHATESLESRQTASGAVEYTCSAAAAAAFRPLHCRLGQWAAAHWWVLLGLMLVAVVALRYVWKARRHWALLRRAEEIYHQVCAELEEHAVESQATSGAGEAKPPWIVGARLRDHLLRPRERKQRALWDEVERLVRDDARIDQYPRLVKGQSRTVWEWQTEGALLSPLQRSRQKALNGAATTVQRAPLPPDNEFTTGGQPRSRLYPPLESIGEQTRPPAKPGTGSSQPSWWSLKQSR
eukprot:SM000027S09678  [mRNA]  locus=s27:750433:753590:+ [translate_table: standard]